MALVIPRSGPSLAPGQTILIVAVELLGVALLTLLAGSSNDAGNIVVLLMLGFWLIYLISDSRTVQKLGGVLNNVANQASA